MLRTELIDLINTKQVWAFIGSGVSADSGLPTWRSLVQKVVAIADLENELASDEGYNRAFKDGDYPECFSILERIIDRKGLEDAVTKIIQQYTTPGRLAKVLADLPFAGYITTNYDTILENALISNGQRDWFSIGNTKEEIRYVSGNPERTIWHVHGSVGLPREKSQLILTTEDYEELYLDTTPLNKQLRGLITHNRCVFIGFSFKDAELERIVRQVRAVSRPDRPLYAFLASTTHDDRKRLLYRTNVEVIPYEVKNRSHEQLIDLIDTYGALCLRRTLRFGQHRTKAPSYDPETTGLLLYNRLVLQSDEPITDQIFSLLLRARILARLQYSRVLSQDEFLEDMAERARLLRGTQSRNVVDDVEHTFTELVDEGLIVLDGHKSYTLSDKGKDMVEALSNKAEFSANRFAQSLKNRAADTNLSPDEISRVADATVDFFTATMEKRALGIAQALKAGRLDRRQYHITALLQELPNYMALLATESEMIVLSQITRDVLANPTESEAYHMGLRVQARFAVHLLGYEPSTLKAQARAIADALFIVDSTMLNALLAQSSPSYDTAHTLVTNLNHLNATVVTTNLIIQEVSEHLNWATRNVDSSTHQPTQETLLIATGRTGSRNNTFLDGYLNEVGEGRIASNFLHYLRESCAIDIEDNRSTVDNISDALTKGGIPIRDLDQWTGFYDELWNQRAEIQETIKERRLRGLTYKHDRQCRAEAEVVTICKNIREGKLTDNGKRFRGTYFISNSSFLNDYIGGQRFVMHDEAVLQWVGALSPPSNEDLSFFIQWIFSELADKGLEIYDFRKLEYTFSPQIDASKRDWENIQQEYHDLISDKYGIDPEDTLTNVAPVFIPTIVESFKQQIAAELKQAKEELLEIERELRAKKDQVRMSTRDQREFAQLKEDKKRRQQKQKRKESKGRKRKK